MKTISVPLLVTLYAGTVKLFAESSEPFIHAVPALRRLQNGVLRVHPSGTKRWKLEGAKSGLQDGWGRVNSRCGLLRVKYLLASSGRVEESW